MSAPADVSRVTRELLTQVRKMVPPLLEKFHKGQMGRVAVVGGSADYTGAPFFSAMASARLGADMSHVVCEAQAAQAIKTYSPNLMVHPLLRLSALAAPGESAETLAAAVVALLPRLHVLVVGPGLGRDRLMLDTCAAVIGAARARNLPLVLDADALLLAQTRPELVQGYRECVLTPNAAEFARLCASKGIADEVAALAEGERAARLARAFGGVLVVQKGPTDFISDGATTLAGDARGCPKRSGGQGDTLTGCIATFLAWRRAYLDEIWDHAGDLDAAALLRLAAFGGSSVTRECSRLAFARHGRSLQAGDLTDEVAAAFLNLFGASEPRL